MKRAFTIVLLLLALTSRAQSGPEVWNLSLTDSSLRILYIGVENRLKFSGIKNPEEIILTLVGGGASLSKDEKSRYIVHASAQGIATLSVYQRGKLVKTIEYKVMLLGRLKAGLNGHWNKPMRKNEILFNPRLTIAFDSSWLKHNIKVVSFTMRTQLNGDSVFIDSENNQLTPQQLAVIRQLNTGSEVVFERIRTNGPEGRTVTFYSFWIKIE